MTLPTLRQLHYLKLLAEHGSFSRAAAAAHVTQPTLSAGVQELERHLGSQVVDRGRTGVILTAVGEEAVRRAADVLARTEDLVQAARSAGRPLSGRFRLGVIPTVAPFLLPRALPRLRERHPELRLFLREDLTARLIVGLRDGTLDAAVIALPYETSGLELEHIAQDELLFAAAAGHPLLEGGEVGREAVQGADLILLDDGHCLRDHAVDACGVDLAGTHAFVEGAFAATSLQTLIQMVGSGLGVSLLPAMAVSAGLTDASQVAVRPLDRGGVRRAISIAWRAGSSRALEAKLFAETFRLD